MPGLRSSRVLTHGGLRAAHAPVWNPGLMTDPDVVALWRFEDTSNLGDDSHDGNDLEKGGSLAISTFHRERKRSAYGDAALPANGAYLRRANADLSANFPLKNPGGTKTCSFTCWLYHTNLATDRNVVFWKENTLRLFTKLWGDQLELWTGAATYLQHAGHMVTGRWYHIGATYDVSGLGSGRIRVWDDTAKALLAADATSAVLGTIGLSDDPFFLFHENNLGGGGGCRHRGYMDEAAFFGGGRVLTPDEIDTIRRGKYKWPK